jgi:SAM-dependent methyltransferase
MNESSYAKYVSDEKLHEKYGAYQERYAENIRESDRVIINIVEEALTRDFPDRPASLLDIGCHTGNLLMHLRRAIPADRLELSGADLVEEVIEACRKDERLDGIRFEVMDMLSLDATDPWDMVIANAVAVYFDVDEYEKAIASIAGALKPGGTYVAFEWLHPWPQDLEIRETSRSHPEGLTIHFRPHEVVEPILRRHGFTEVEFRAFEIPIDLERGEKFRDDLEGFEDLNSYTRTTADGERLIFRGILFQPWCHIVARKGD